MNPSPEPVTCGCPDCKGSNLYPCRIAGVDKVRQELLEACKALIGDQPPAGEPGHVDFADAVKLARAAIAKAEA